MTTSSRKSKGTHKTGDNTYMSAVNVETTMSAMKRSTSTRRRIEWSGQQNGSSEKYRYVYSVSTVIDLVKSIFLLIWYYIWLAGPREDCQVP
jgi:hypothetical protein